MSETSWHEPTDAQIAELSAQQRRVLIERLERPISDVIAPHRVGRVRAIRLGLMAGAATALIPWIVFLGLSLPDRYVTQHWVAVWVGFDCLLVTSMAITALLGWRRRLLVAPASFATGVLLLCDAWFDVLTADRGDVMVSLLTAFLAELPLAFIMMTGAMRLMRFVALRLWLIEPGTPLWRVEIPL
ncbi:hypothetical protein P0W64_17315 [Tsukamurella sp. 8F]|uniref:hypothetical protein n=1 Tax=unclassified Tsukamurella TaxID=2633480 RepID=UPI0023B8BD5B|nr:MULTISPECIES: hypothetical protein [unclassified Tsukamurella]MDF0531338.1 hypothetical protein [Tsukamurella sp. 8J]MDF0588544.1 hypothetical protein [Tsukamurella sp. 8F]